MVGLGPVSLILAAILVSACQRGDGAKVAEVDHRAILASDLQKFAGRELSVQRENLYKLEKQKLDQYISAFLLTQEAKKRGVSVEAVLDQEVNSKILAVGDDEIDVFYKSNKAQIAVDLDKVREQIRSYLHNQKIEAQKALFLKSLRSNAKVVTYLKSPPVFRAEISVAGEPFKGSEKAPVTVVKFEDFQCPFCKQVQPTFNQLLSRYNGKVRLVHKDLPLESLHPQARQAAEAARCAYDQGKFWEYHDKLYATSPKASGDDLKSYAKEVGLNVDSFDRCFTSGKYKAVVQQDLNEGVQLGLTGTPTIFVNGREISGNQSLEAFEAIIDEELARRK
ncbi:MAG: thioredoxin domain-containing protein [Candidatus Binatia bacterium]